MNVEELNICKLCTNYTREETVENKCWSKGSLVKESQVKQSVMRALNIVQEFRSRWILDMLSPKL